MKILNEVIRFATLVLPAGWVMTCAELGIRWIYTKPIEGILTLAASMVISFFLYAVGYTAAGEGETDLSPGADMTVLDRLKRFAALFCALLVITLLIARKVR